MFDKFLTALVTLGLAGTGLVACAQQSEVASTMEPGPRGQAVARDTLMPQWQALVGPTTDAGTVKGEVTIRATAEGGTYSAIAIEGAEAGSVHPWHVHAGDCGEGGEIVGAASAYNPIEVGDAGEGRATATLAVSLTPEGDYYINVHESPTDLGTIVACGEVDSQ